MDTQIQDALMTSDNPLINFGRAYRAGLEAIPLGATKLINPEYGTELERSLYTPIQPGIAATIGGALGSATVFVPAVLAAPGYAAIAGAAAIGVGAASMGGEIRGNIYQQRLAGKDISLTHEALATLGMMAGSALTEAPVLQLFKPAIAGASRNVLRQIGARVAAGDARGLAKLLIHEPMNGNKAVRELYRSLAAGIAGEAGQEGLEQLIENEITKTFDTARGHFDNLIQSTIGGAIGGGALTGLYLGKEIYTTRQRDLANLEIARRSKPRYDRYFINYGEPEEIAYASKTNFAEPGLDVHETLINRGAILDFNTPGLMESTVPTRTDNVKDVVNWLNSYNVANELRSKGYGVVRLRGSTDLLVFDTKIATMSTPVWRKRFDPVYTTSEPEPSLDELWFMSAPMLQIEKKVESDFGLPAGSYMHMLDELPASNAVNEQGIRKYSYDLYKTLEETFTIEGVSTEPHPSTILALKALDRIRSKTIPGSMFIRYGLEDTVARYKFLKDTPTKPNRLIKYFKKKQVTDDELAWYDIQGYVDQMNALNRPVDYNSLKNWVRAHNPIIGVRLASEDETDIGVFNLCKVREYTFDSRSPFTEVSKTDPGHFIDYGTEHGHVSMGENKNDSAEGVIWEVQSKRSHLGEMRPSVVDMERENKRVYNEIVRPFIIAKADAATKLNAAKLALRRKLPSEIVDRPGFSKHGPVAIGKWARDNGKLRELGPYIDIVDNAITNYNQAVIDLSLAEIHPYNTSWHASQKAIASAAQVGKNAGLGEHIYKHLTVDKEGNHYALFSGLKQPDGRIYKFAVMQFPNLRSIGNYLGIEINTVGEYENKNHVPLFIRPISTIGHQIYERLVTDISNEGKKLIALEKVRSKIPTDLKKTVRSPVGKNWWDQQLAYAVWYMAANGYDRVHLATGGEVSSIWYDTVPKGKWTVTVRPVQEDVQFHIPKLWSSTFRFEVVSEHVSTEDRLQLQRILNSVSKQSLEITVLNDIHPNQGLVDLYDKKFRSSFEKLAKQIGAKISEDGHTMDISDFDVKQKIFHRPFSAFQLQTSEQQRLPLGQFKYLIDTAVASGLFDNVVLHDNQLYDRMQPVNGKVWSGIKQNRRQWEMHLSPNVDVSTVGHEMFERVFNDPVLSTHPEFAKLLNEGLQLTSQLVPNLSTQDPKERLADAVGRYYSDLIMPKTLMQRIGDWIKRIFSLFKQVSGEDRMNEVAKGLAEHLRDLRGGIDLNGPTTPYGLRTKRVNRLNVDYMSTILNISPDFLEGLADRAQRNLGRSSLPINIQETMRRGRELLRNPSAVQAMLDRVRNGLAMETEDQFAMWVQYRSNLASEISSKIAIANELRMRTDLPALLKIPEIRQELERLYGSTMVSGIEYHPTMYPMVGQAIKQYLNERINLLEASLMNILFAHPEAPNPATIAGRQLRLLQSEYHAHTASQAWTQLTEKEDLTKPEEDLLHVLGVVHKIAAMTGQLYGPGSAYEEFTKKYVGLIKGIPQEYVYPSSGFVRRGELESTTMTNAIDKLSKELRKRHVLHRRTKKISIVEAKDIYGKDTDGYALIPRSKTGLDVKDYAIRFGSLQELGAYLGRKNATIGDTSVKNGTIITKKDYDASEIISDVHAARNYLSEQVATYLDDEGNPVSNVMDAATVRIELSPDAIQRPKISDMMKQVWYNSVLSSFKDTHVINFASNSLFWAYQFPHRGLTGMIDAMWSSTTGKQREVFAGEMIRMFSGIGPGIRTGARKATDVFKTGLTFGDSRHSVELGFVTAAAMEHSKSPVIRALAPVVGSGFSRALMGVDMMFKAVAVQEQINALAYRESQITGRSEKEILDEIVRGKREDLWDEALKFASYSTFMDKPGKVRTAYMGLRRAVPALYYITPFINTVTNITMRATEFTPGVGMAVMRNRIKSGELPVADAIARQLEGAMILAALLARFDRDEITGPPPKGKPQKDAFYRMGKQPWSFKVDGAWVSYRDAEPFGGMIGAFGVVNELLQESTDEKAATELFGHVAYQLGSYFLNSTWMNNIGRYLEENNAIGAFTKIPLGFVPNSGAAADIVEMMDQTRPGYTKLRESKTVYDTWMKQWGGLLTDQPVRFKKNLYGKDVEVPLKIGPMRISAESLDPVDKALYEIDAFPMPPIRTIHLGKGQDIELTDDLYIPYMQEFGEDLHERLTRVVGSESWDKRSDLSKARVLNRIRDRVGTIHRRRMVVRLKRLMREVG